MNAITEQGGAVRPQFLGIASPPLPVWIGAASLLAIAALLLGPVVLGLLLILLLAAAMVPRYRVAFLAFMCFLPSLGELESNAYLPNIWLVFYAILLASWLYTALTRPRKIYLDLAITSAYCAFLLVCLLSEIGSYDLTAFRGVTLAASPNRIIWEPLLVTSTAILAMSGFENRGQLRRILWALVLSGIVYAPTVFFWGTESEAGGRRSGVFTDAGPASIHMLFCTIAALSLLRSSSKGARIVLSAAAGLFLVTQLFTVSKSVMVVAVVLVLLSALIDGGIKRLGTAVLVLTLVAGLAFVVAPDRIRAPVAQIITSLLFDSQAVAADMGGRVSTFAARTWSVEAGLRAASEHPWLGVGWGKHMTWIGLNDPMDAGNATSVEFHVRYIIILAEVGITGFLIYLGIIYLTLRTNLRLLRRFRDGGDAAMFSIAKGLLLSMVAVLVTFLAAPGRQDGAMIFWVLVGLTAALGRLAAEEKTVFASTGAAALAQPGNED